MGVLGTLGPPYLNGDLGILTHPPTGPRQGYHHIPVPNSDIWVHHVPTYSTHPATWIRFRHRRYRNEQLFVSFEAHGERAVMKSCAPVVRSISLNSVAFSNSIYREPET